MKGEDALQNVSAAKPWQSVENYEAGLRHWSDDHLREEADHAVQSRHFADLLGISKVAALKKEMEPRGIADFYRHHLQNILWR
jgi:hypothetical protein